MPDNYGIRSPAERYTARKAKAASKEAARQAEAERQAREARAREPLPESETNPVPVVLGRDTASNQPITLTLNERVRGLYVVGLNGTGKSNLILEMISQDISEGHGVCLLDPHGDLTNALLDRIPPEREDDLIILDMNVEHAAWGLNIFTCPNPQSTEDVTSTIDYVEQTFERLWDMESTAGLADLLHSVTVTFVYNPGSTITDIPRLLTDAQYRGRLIRTVKDQMVKDFWELQYDSLSESSKQSLYASLMRRLRKLMTPLLYSIVSQRTNSLDFRTVMDEGKILLVQLHPKMRNVTELLGTVIVGQLLIAALSREDTLPDRRRPFYLYADEYHRFATSAFGDLIQEARKYNIATVMAHQLRYQLRVLGEAVSKAPLGAPNLILFQLEAEDARELVSRFDPPQPEPAIIGQKPKKVVAGNPLALVRASKQAQDPAIYPLLEAIEQYITTIPLSLAYRYYEYTDAELARMRREQTDAAWDEVERIVASIVHKNDAMAPQVPRYIRDSGMYFKVIQLAVSIRDNPPKVDALNEFEPEYASPKSPYDLRQELITRLTTMSKYTAYCKTAQGEYLIRTLYNPVPVNLEKRERLRAHSRQRYYRAVAHENPAHEPQPTAKNRVSSAATDEQTANAIINPPLTYAQNDISPTQSDHNDGEDWFNDFGDPKTS